MSLLVSASQLALKEAQKSNCTSLPTATQAETESQLDLTLPAGIYFEFGFAETLSEIYEHL